VSKEVENIGMSSIFDKDIMNVVTQYTNEDYIIGKDYFSNTMEIIVKIPLCKHCGNFADFKEVCKTRTAGNRTCRIENPIQPINEEDMKSFLRRRRERRRRQTMVDIF
jgi:hypothetical protein